MTMLAQKANFCFCPCESSEALTLLLPHVRQCNAVFHLQKDRTSAAACALPTSNMASSGYFCKGGEKDRKQ